MRSRTRCAWITVALGALGGCSRAETAADKHIAEMRDQITKIQAEQDRTDHRLSALEVATAEDRTGRLVETQPTPAAANPAHAGPPPRVVALGAAESPQDDDPNDPSPRPEIRVVGAGGGVAHGRRTDPGRPSALDPEAKRAYDAALAQVRAKSYDRALEGLTAFLVRWPDHPYAENATYWRGETLYAKGEYARAAEQFEAVLSRFGGGAKAPDALLKLGMCQERLGAPDRAKELYDRLRADYPRSDAAKHIPAVARDDRSPKGPKETR